MNKFKSSGFVEYDGLEDFSVGKDMKLDESLEKIKDEFLEFLNFTKDNSGKGATSHLRPSLFAGVEAPFLKNKLSLGFLYRVKFGYTGTQNDITLSFNARPKRWFNVGVNYTLSLLNATNRLGWILEFMPRAGSGSSLAATACSSR